MNLPFRYGLAPGALAITAIAVLAGVSWFMFLRDDGDDGAGDRAPLVFADLPAPAGLSFGLDGILVASLGSGDADGAVYILRADDDEAEDDDVSLLVEGLSSSAPASDVPLLDRSGPMAAVDVGGAVAVVVGGVADGVAAVVYRAPLRPGAAAEQLAEVPREGPSAVFDLARGPDGELFVSDPAAQRIIRISEGDEPATFARFATVRPPEGEPYAEHPAGLAMGPDGGLYVAVYAGGTNVDERSRVYRLRDRNGDGDADDAGERQVAADGLTDPVDLAFGPDGVLYVVERGSTTTVETDEAGATPIRGDGRLWRLADLRADVVVDDLVTPLSVIIDGAGRAFVSEYAANRIRIIPDAAPPEPDPEP